MGVLSSVFSSLFPKKARKNTSRLRRERAGPVRRKTGATTGGLLRPRGTSAGLSGGSLPGHESVAPEELVRKVLDEAAVGVVTVSAPSNPRLARDLPGRLLRIAGFRK